MGIGVGAACPVLLSSIGTNKNGKRTALIYLLNDLFGMIFWSIVFYSVNAIVHFPFMGEIMSPFRVALLNTVFRLLTILVLAPFIGKIEKLVFFLIKETTKSRQISIFLRNVSSIIRHWQSHRASLQSTEWQRKHTKISVAPLHC